MQKAEDRFTYRQLLTWPEGERWELIDGIAYDMTPAPTTPHQRISGRLFNQFFNYLDGKSCEVFAAPFDVLLPMGNETEEEVDTVVEPDITIVCDHNKLTERGCFGAPELVVEILSPSTARKDLREKFAAYQRAGVREYWIVDPANRLVTVYRLGENQRYGQSEIFAPEDTVSVEVLEGLTIDLSRIFAE